MTTDYTPDFPRALFLTLLLLLGPAAPAVPVRLLTGLLLILWELNWRKFCSWSKFQKSLLYRSLNSSAWKLHS